MDAALKVISFNLKRDSFFHRKNSWQNRKYLASQVIQKSGADIIGVQELMPAMRDDILKLLRGYSIFGLGRSRHLQNEQSSIIFRNQETDICFWKTFWLSKNPEKQGSRAYFSFFPRICTVGEVYVKHLNSRIRIFNTHFDHICGPARRLGVQIILEYMHQLNQKEKLPTILMGDLNAKPNSMPIRILSDNLHHYPDIHLTNIYDCMDSDKIRNTYHGFKGKQKAKPIDYIFLSEEFEVSDVTIDSSCINGCYPSDHFPLIATLRLKKHNTK